MKKNYTVEVYDSEEEWIYARRLSGSNASAVLDQNPYMSKVELYNEIINKLDKKNIKEIKENIKKKTKNETLIYGHKAEPLIRRLVALNLKKEYKIEAPKGYVLYRRIDKPYLTATVDSLMTRLSDGLEGIQEIKTRECRSEKEYNEWAVERKIPQNYYIQLLHYFVVLNDKKYIYLSPKLIQGIKNESNNKWEISKETILYGLIIWRSEVQKEVDYLERKLTEFWENNILKRSIPTIEFNDE